MKYWATAQSNFDLITSILSIKIVFKMYPKIYKIKILKNLNVNPKMEIIKQVNRTINMYKLICI